MEGAPGGFVGKEDTVDSVFKGGRSARSLLAGECRRLHFFLWKCSFPEMHVAKKTHQEEILQRLDLHIWERNVDLSGRDKAGAFRQTIWKKEDEDETSILVDDPGIDHDRDDGL